MRCTERSKIIVIIITNRAENDGDNNINKLHSLTCRRALSSLTEMRCIDKSYALQGKNGKFTSKHIPYIHDTHI